MAQASITGTLNVPAQPGNSRKASVEKIAVPGNINTKVAEATQGNTAAVSATIDDGDKLRLNSDHIDSSVSGTGSLDNSAGTAAVRIRKMANSTEVETVVTAAAGATEAFTFTLAGNGADERLEVVAA